MKLSAAELIVIYAVSLLILGPVRLPQLLHMLCDTFSGKRKKPETGDRGEVSAVFSQKQTGSRMRRFYFRFYLQGWLIFVVILSLASLICALLQRITSSDVHVPMIFVLAVLIVSLSTDGYFYGLLAAIVSVIGVNYAFTYPYMKLDFSVYGYPLTFMTMLAVGFACSTLAFYLRRQEQLRVETERERMRANLLRSISHDLRTPLTSISGSITTVLEEDSLSRDVRRELLSGAKQDAEWLCRMVENILSITRISGESGKLAKSEELLEEVLSEAIQRFRKRPDAVPVSVSVPEEAQLLSMDPTLIEQVLSNLMDNAVTHGTGVTQIWIEAKKADHEFVVSVRDNGCGIEENLLPHLFDGSLPLSGKSRSDGSRFMGIGLSVCRTIVETHGGRIWAENVPEGGAVFCFTLPEGGENDDGAG